MSNLITLERAKSQLPSNADDLHTSNLITACSATVERYCNRTFAQGTYDELHHGTGTLSLFLANPPLVSVTAVRTSPIPALWVQNADNTNQAATVQVYNGNLVLTTLKNGATPTVTNLSFTTYPNVAGLVAAINGVGGSWTAQLSQQFATWASADLTANIGAFGARQLTVPLIVHWYYVPSFQVNANLGEIFSYAGFVEGFQNYRVQYIGGFSIIPDEIQQACAELVQMAYASKSWTPGINTETLDKYSYTRAAENGFSQLSITAKQALNYSRIPKVSRFVAI